ncbi:MAG: UDP-N-acetylmuramoyl-L-alanyl-D-glutamate--2,6-diaminopimelate ligase [Ardenticatenaceae bacterium]|nr:UDP-N-acetylmuramoyl-L-alanyl-D-glutamate--2,6-diaminopimelate ligase [Ardenticatenaceae bacterium]
MIVSNLQSPLPQSRHLKQLLADWQTAVEQTPIPHHLQPPTYTGPDVTLTHLTEKTSEVRPGACFIARVRTSSDGHPYIGQAIERGASMILAQRSPADLGLTIPENVIYIQVEDTAETLAWLAAAWYGFPSQHLTIIGITGTDGKSSTSRLLHEILIAAGLKAGLLSTIKAVIGPTEEPLELHVTTPEAPVVQSYLRRMVDAGLTHCVLETTSHSLAQHRVTAVNFHTAVITNITHEHIDYHGSHAAYFAAKARLFQLATHQTILNRDDSSYEGLAQASTVPHLTYAIHQPAAITATHLTYTPTQTTFTLHLPSSPLSLCTPLVGEFNIYNMLAAAAAAHSLGVAPTAIKAGLEAVDVISGRMERIDEGQPFLTIVDFAHTPNALTRAIEAGKRMVPNGRIITVFGSAGKRDVEKRRLMAEASARAADLTILTAEDPRTESLNDILNMMAAGCRSQGGIEHETFWRIPDRGRAIHFALSRARPQDLVLICGKGHEQSMCFGTIEYPWDDRTATRAALRAFLNGTEMPSLGLPTH